MKPFDAVVIGAGIVGCAVAREAASAGLRTALVEGGVPAGGASAAGMGHVVVMDDSPAQLALTAYSRDLWRQERTSLPASAEYEERGTIWIAGDEEEMAEVEVKRNVYMSAGIASSLLSPSALHDLEPNLRDGLSGGLLVAEDGVIYPPAAAAFYLAEAQRFGAQLFRFRATHAHEGTVRLSDGRVLQASRIVLAVGTECDLLPSLPVEKRKGHLLITDRYPGFVHHQLVEMGYLKSAHKVVTDSVAFNVQPRQTGQLLIGSSRQYGSADRAVDAEILRQMLDRATSYMPGLRELSTLRVWTGFRAATRDKLPLIGPALGLSEDQTLWLAAGFEGLGITNAPGAAKLLVDSMLGRQSQLSAKPYLPMRFASLPGLAYA